VPFSEHPRAARALDAGAGRDERGEAGVYKRPAKTARPMHKGVLFAEKQFGFASEQGTYQERMHMFLTKKNAVKTQKNVATKQTEAARKADKVRELQLSLLDSVSGGGCGPRYCN
jgi:hypothetical protein